MDIKALSAAPQQLATAKIVAPPNDAKLRETFDSFIGETFYGQMLQAMRKTTGKAPYFDGGQAEEVFRKQLDQTLAQRMAKADPGRFSESMYNLFSLQRS